MLDDDGWRTTEVRPVGYAVTEDGDMIIAFDAPKLSVRADYYELIVTETSADRIWLGTQDARTNMRSRKHEFDFLAVDTPTLRRAALIAPYRTDHRFPGIERLRNGRTGQVDSGQ